MLLIRDAWAFTDASADVESVLYSTFAFMLILA